MLKNKVFLFLFCKSCALCNWLGRTLWPDNHVLGQPPCYTLYTTIIYPDIHYHTLVYTSLYSIYCIPWYTLTYPCIPHYTLVYPITHVYSSISSTTTISYFSGIEFVLNIQYHVSPVYHALLYLVTLHTSPAYHCHIYLLKSFFIMHYYILLHQALPNKHAIATVV